jgi:hypothetical protein
MPCFTHSPTVLISPRTRGDMDVIGKWGPASHRPVHAVTQLVDALRYKSKGHGFDS